MNEFDVIIVGAGTAGCVAAKTAAKAGLKVALIDRKNASEIGDKICGDAVGKHHFDALGIAPPFGHELRSIIEGIRVYSPDMQTTFTIKSESLYGFIVNRPVFGQRLLKLAQDAGATLLDSTQVTEPIFAENAVVGVFARDMKNRTSFQLQSKVVIDASGFSAVLRKKLPVAMGIEPHVSNEDVEACYREIRQLDEKKSSPVFCEIYLNQNVAPGGYYWVFPAGQTKINVGVGVSMNQNFPKPRGQLYTGVLSKPLFRGSSVVTGGSWYVPTRRPLDNMVGNGIILAGDAACQVNPIHGGGIGPSLKGGTLAGETAIEALEKDNVTRNGFWRYNVRYMQSYGAKQAGLDIFRLFLLHGVSDEDINYGMKYRIIQEEDILKTSMGEDVHLNVTEATKRALKGFGRLSFLNRLRKAGNLMRAIKELYRTYPDSPSNFEEWMKQVSEVLNSANTLLSQS